MRNAIAKTIAVLVFAVIVFAFGVYPFIARVPLTGSGGKAEARLILVFAVGAAVLAYVVVERLLSYIPTPKTQPKVVELRPRSIAVTPEPVVDPLLGKMDPNGCPECGKALRYVQQHLRRQHGLNGVFVHPAGDRSHWMTYA